MLHVEVSENKSSITRPLVCSHVAKPLNKTSLCFAVVPKAGLPAGSGPLSALTRALARSPGFLGSSGAAMALTKKWPQKSTNEQACPAQGRERRKAKARGRR